MTLTDLDKILDRAKGRDKMMEFYGVCAAFPFTMSIGVLNYYVNGRVMHKLWEWFVTPAFGIPAPAVVYLVGMMSMVGMTQLWLAAALSKKPDKAPDANSTSAKRMWVDSITGLVTPFISLGIGYLIHLFA